MGEPQDGRNRFPGLLPLGGLCAVQENSFWTIHSQETLFDQAMDIITFVYDISSFTSANARLIIAFVEIFGKIHKQKIREKEAPAIPTLTIITANIWL